MQAPTLFVIAGDLSHMQVLASVDESDIGRVQQGQPVSFTVDAYPGETFTGQVAQVRLQPAVDQNVVSYTTVIDVPNRSQKLKPGMTANVKIETARADDVLRVPAAALRFQPPSESGEGRAQAPRTGGGRRVGVWEDGGMQPVRVEAGLSDGTMTAITGGALVEGADVVTGMAGATPRASATAATSPLLPLNGRRGAGAGARGAAGAGR
jgi:HlyD family secretion protein